LRGGKGLNIQNHSMMQIRIARSIRLFVHCGMTAFLLLSVFISCKKSTPVAPVPITPLQTLINSDSTLTLYHRLILQANETGLLADKAITLLIPTNAALRAAGYSPGFIDSISTTQADNLVRYHYISSRVSIPVADSGGYTGYTTLLGPQVFAMSDGIRIWFNGIQAIADTEAVGQALVFRLNAPLPVAYDSLDHLLAADTSLSFLAELFLRTGLDSVLSSGNYTLFAPVNSAFINAGYDSIGAIDSADLTSLTRLAKYQVVPGLFFTNNLTGLSTLPTLEGSPIGVGVQNGQLQFTGNSNPVPARLINGNQPAGVTFIVHRIDQLLLP
jgi:uncharacterized surface protein with fasciclin (FAS1) repeats